MEEKRYSNEYSILYILRLPRGSSARVPAYWYRVPQGGAWIILEILASKAKNRAYRIRFRTEPESIAPWHEKRGKHRCSDLWGGAKIIGQDWCKIQTWLLTSNLQDKR
jgi:hypothetical protein